MFTLLVTSCNQLCVCVHWNLALFPLSHRIQEKARSKPFPTVDDKTTAVTYHAFLFELLRDIFDKVLEGYFHGTVLPSAGDPDLVAPE